MNGSICCLPVYFNQTHVFSQAKQQRMSIKQGKARSNNENKGVYVKMRGYVWHPPLMGSGNSGWRRGEQGEGSIHRAMRASVLTRPSEWEYRTFPSCHLHLIYLERLAVLGSLTLPKEGPIEPHYEPRRGGVRLPVGCNWVRVFHCL